MTAILLLRHAQSTWNAEGRWQGSADPPLSEKGAADARALGAALAGHAVAALGRPGRPSPALVSSDLVRARATADLIAAATGWGPVESIPGLRERDVGAFAGLTRAEIEQRWPGILEHTPLEPPGGESRAALVARAIVTLHRLADDHGDRPVLAVTHGALIRAVELHVGVTEAGAPANLTGRWFDVGTDHLLAGTAVTVLDDGRRARGPAAGEAGGVGDVPLDPGALVVAALDHVQLAMPPGDDAERAAEAFYAGVLGIPRVGKPAPLAARGGCWFEAAGLRVHLGVEEDFRPARKAHPAFLVADLAAVVGHLEAAGVRTRTVEEVPGLRQCYVEDPFGNRIELLEREATGTPAAPASHSASI